MDENNTTIEETMASVEETTQEDIQNDDIPTTTESSTENGEDIADDDKNDDSSILETVESTEDAPEHQPDEVPDAAPEQTTEEETTEEETTEIDEEITIEEILDELYDTYFGHRVYYNSAGYPYYLDENGDRVYITDTENIIHAGENTEESTEEIETETTVELPILEKPLNEYTVSEGLLLLIFILGLVAFIYHVVFDK